MRAAFDAFPVFAVLAFCVSAGAAAQSIADDGSLKASPSASTIYATWSSAVPSGTRLSCGTAADRYDIAAVDTDTQSAVTAHSGIVAGLTPSTHYFCQAAGDRPILFEMDTLAIPPSTPLISATINLPPSEPVADQIEGDTFYSAQSDDGTTYVGVNDTHTFGNGFSANMMVGKFTSLSPLTGTNVSIFPSFGNIAQCVGDLGNGRSWKETGLYSQHGVLYLWASRMATPACGPTPGENLFALEFGAIFKSVDHGENWANFQAPTTYNNLPPDFQSPLMFSAVSAVASDITAAKPGIVATAAPHGLTGSWMPVVITGSVPSTYDGTFIATVIDKTHFSIGIDTSAFGTYRGGAQIAYGTTLASGSPVMYGPDDGTLGYRVDNAEAYIYVLYTEGLTINSSNLYLARVPKAKISNLKGGEFEVYVGGDGLFAASWSSNLIKAVPVLTAPKQISLPSMQFMPDTGRYVLHTYYYAKPAVTSNTTWTVYEAPHPWGPFSLIAKKNWTPEGYFNPTVIPASAITATANGNPFTLIFSGDFAGCCSPAGYYHLNSATEVLRTH